MGGISDFRSGSERSEEARSRLGAGVERGIPELACPRSCLSHILPEVGPGGRRRELFCEKVGDDDTFTPSCPRADEINGVMW